MADLAKFEQAVKQLVNNDEKWLHVLPAVPEQYRQRFLDIIASGISIPKAYDLVLVTTGMKDEDFHKKLFAMIHK